MRQSRVFTLREIRVIVEDTQIQILYLLFTLIHKLSFCLSRL